MKNRDSDCIVKYIVDNLAVEYPALINQVVPEKISYALLQKVMVGLLKRGDQPCCYMVKTIEIMEDELLKNPEAGADDLITAIASVIEGEDNYSVFMHNRRT